jgi:hypothetical protein
LAILLPITMTARSVAWMKCLRSLGRWNREFESHSRHGSLYALFYVCVVLCVGNGLATGCSPVQGILPECVQD